MTGRVNRMIKSTNKFTYKLGSDGKIVKEIEEDFQKEKQAYSIIEEEEEQ